MFISPTRRSDLVLGMSLAEVVLLLLFGFFIAEVVEREVSGGEDPNVTVAALREENARLRQNIAELEKKVEDLDTRFREREMFIKELIRMVGGTQGDDLPSIRRKIIGVKRGFPVCADQNTLVEVVARDGTLELVLLKEDATLAGHLAGKGLVLQRDQKLRSEREIDMFLQSVWEFENRTGEKCRFDYRLRYRSASDYHNARQKVERYLYPERIVQIAP